MRAKISSVEFVASDAPSEEIRDIVSPNHVDSQSCVGVLLHHDPPWLVDVSSGKRLDAPFSTPAVGMAFRPVVATEVNGARNQEVAIVYGTSAVAVEFYDIALGAWLERLYFPRAQSVTYSHQGDKLAIGSSRGYVVVYDLNGDARRKELFTVHVSKSAVVRMAFTAQGESLVALTAGGGAHVVDIATGTAKECTVRGKGEDDDFECWAHALHADARLAAFAGSVNRGSGNCRVWLYSLDDGKRVSIETGHKVFVRCLQFTGDQQLMVIGDAGAQVFDLVTRQKCAEGKKGAKQAYTAIQAGSCAFVVASKNSSKKRAAA